MTVQVHAYLCMCLCEQCARNKSDVNLCKVTETKAGSDSRQRNGNLLCLDKYEEQVPYHIVSSDGQKRFLTTKKV